MPDETQSEYNQLSFTGGMNLLGDDTRLQPNEYRAGFNLTNREDQLDPVLQSQEDVAIPKGIKQELVTFGNYLIAFVNGLAYYRYYTDTGWKLISGFKMSSSAPRFWTIAVSVATTNYVRYATASGKIATTTDPSMPILLVSIASASAGNLPGLLVQDNISQPQFIFIAANGFPTARTTQNFAQWGITYTDINNTVVAQVGGVFQDNREYVPIGNTMTYDDGVLYIASQDGNFMYRSVSGRPLDFVVNVTNKIADNTTTPPFTQRGGGDATTTSYSVGVGPITCLRPMSSGGIFVAAGNANFVVTKNRSPGAPTVFGEYTFDRLFLFNATCLSDRAIFDSTGDTRFIDLTGVRSFNAVKQAQNEGRNSPFTKEIQPAFTTRIAGVKTTITQDPALACGILYDNYELYGVTTSFGPAIVKYDTINGCWTSFDTIQTGGKRIKILAKIELSIQRLYAITEDDRLYTLYIGPNLATATVRSIGVCANQLYANTNIKMNNPKSEIQLRNTRVVVNNLIGNCNLSFTPYVDNRRSPIGNELKVISFAPPTDVSNEITDLDDVNTLLCNAMFSTPNAAQGWKMFGVFSWSAGSITQFSYELNNVTPMNPINSQGDSI